MEEGKRIEKMLHFLLRAGLLCARVCLGYSNSKKLAATNILPNLFPAFPLNNAKCCPSVAHTVKYTAKSAFHSFGQDPQAVLLGTTLHGAACPAQRRSIFGCLVQVAALSCQSPFFWSDLHVSDSYPRKLGGNNLTISGLSYKNLFAVHSLAQSTKYMMYLT